ncbi:MAG: hypothetical protein WAN57_05205 [Smithella sp.]
MTEIIFDKDEDWERRILCSDESCIGVIGSDGKCKECGRIYKDELSHGCGVDNVQTVTPEEQKPALAAAKAEYDEDWDKRVLCGDESCIGVIGSDGKCKECGKPL